MHILTVEMGTWYNAIEVMAMEHWNKGHGFHDLSGQRFGRLVAIGKADRMCGRKCYWDCLCDCGNKKIVRSDSLVGGTIRSCGCLKREAEVKNFSIVNNHKQTRSPLYNRWNSMIQRCKNPNTAAYKYYGGRGIIVCDEWKNINCFIEWAERNGYKENLTIDRIDVNGNYEPSNCRWITMAEQSYNRTDSVYHTWEGETLTTMQWVHKYNIPLAVAWGYKANGVPFTEIISKYASKTIPR